jgi:hypothetical protein
MVKSGTILLSSHVPHVRRRTQHTQERATTREPQNDDTSLSHTLLGGTLKKMRAYFSIDSYVALLTVDSFASSRRYQISSHVHPPGYAIGHRPASAS